MPRFALGVLLAAGLAAGACGSNGDVITAPSTDPTTFTDTFTGTLNKNGAASYPFASSAGLLSATLTAVGPETTQVVGLAIGTWNGAACQIVLANDKATTGTVVIGNASTATTLCVRIYDVGSVANTAEYRIDVVHP